MLNSEANLQADVKRLFEVHGKSIASLGSAAQILKEMKEPNVLEILEKYQAEVYIHGCMIEAMKANNRILFEYNPIVMNAAIQTMRYSAFFRHIKYQYPLVWVDFLTQIENVDISDTNLYTPEYYSDLR